MLSVYIPKGTSLERFSVDDGSIPPNAIWIDLISPTPQEDRVVESYIGVSVPTREEMQEIEVSSRLYVENGARYMTATLMYQSDTETPLTTATLIGGCMAMRIVVVRLFPFTLPFVPAVTAPFFGDIQSLRSMRRCG